MKQNLLSVFVFLVLSGTVPDRPFTIKNNTVIVNPLTQLKVQVVGKNPTTIIIKAL